MRQWCTRCVGYLPRRTRQAMNKDARVKFYLHEAKFCICSAWFFVHLPSHWTKEHCVEVGVMYAAPSDFFLFLQKVSGQWILARCIKDFIFVFVAHIHALTKLQVQKIYLSWIPKCLPSFYYYFFKREILEKFCFNCSPFFLEKLKRGWVKVA